LASKGTSRAAAEEGSSHTAVPALTFCPARVISSMKEVYEGAVKTLSDPFPKRPACRRQVHERGGWARITR
jgi:hypothetical protein